ncbi:MAG: aldo/keto reductase [Alphaproteobacteria bacterium]|nr:aldo/keto reductase [Alphaproteobacteria bacterium]
MRRLHQVGEWSRRQALAMVGGFGIVPLSATLGAAAEGINPGDTGPIMTRSIPSTGERLPVIGLGTAWKYGSDTHIQPDPLDEVVRTLVAGGGSVVDTASDYGAAETRLGAVLAASGLRPRVFIATKLETDELAQQALQGSLRRLRVSRIDLMQVHNVGWSGQDLAPLRDWKAQGLVRYIGITTSTVRAFDAVEAVMRREKPDFVELNYSLGDRWAEQRLLPAAHELGIATVIDTPFGGLEDARGNLFRAVQTKPLPDWAHEFGAATWAQFFLKYLLANGAVTVVIPGTANPEHMRDNLAAGRGHLPDATMRQRMAQFIDSLA